MEPSGSRGPALVGSASTVPLWRNSTLVGRADPAGNTRPDADLTESDDRRTVSRRHAELLQSIDGLQVRDLGSTNGTYVNGIRLEPGVACPVADGDTVAFGGVRFTYATSAPWPRGLIPEWDAGTLIATRSMLEAGRRPPSISVHRPGRVLATLLFTDIAGSTAAAAAAGDTAWIRLLEEHNRITRAEIERRQGRAIKGTGDGFLAIFDSPAPALRCAFDVITAVKALGIEVRAGLHTGETEVLEDEVTGISVHIAARVVAAARPGEVLVTGTLRELLTGSDLRFQSRGARPLRGVPGTWRLYAFEGYGEGGE